MLKKGNNPIGGAMYLFRALPMLTQPGIRPYVLIPLAINIVLFIAAIAVSAYYFDAWVNEYIPTGDDYTGWLAWLGWLIDALYWLIWTVFIIGILIAVFFTFSIVANFIASPFNGLLAEVVELKLTGQPLPDGGIKQALKDIGPTLWMEVQKLLYFAMWAIPLGILFLIPVLNWFAPFIWMIFSAWMMSLQYMDYPMSNNRMPFKLQRQKQSARRFYALGFGGTTMAATLIPVVNFLVMPTAVIGATLMWVESFKQDA